MYPFPPTGTYNPPTPSQLTHYSYTQHKNVQVTARETDYVPRNLHDRVYTYVVAVSECSSKKTKRRRESRSVLYPLYFSRTTTAVEI